MTELTQALDLAVAFFWEGDLARAEQHCQFIVREDPQHVDALHLLGLIARRGGRADRAVEYLEAVLRLRPDFAEARSNLGIALYQLGKRAEAADCFEEAARLKPSHAEALSNLGNIRREEGRREEAAALYRQALTFKPNFFDALRNLGDVLWELGKFAEAETSYRQALILQPDSAVTHCNLGISLRELGRHEEAQACLLKALHLKPDFAEAHSHLGNVYWHQDKSAEAVASLKQALHFKPDLADAHGNLGIMHWQTGSLEEAAACLLEAIRLQPTLASAHRNLGLVRADQGLVEEAIECFREALRRKPDFADAQTNLVFNLSYCAGTTLAQLAQAHAEFERRHAAPFRSAWHPHDNRRDPEKRLRLGFVSGDLGQHPVGFFLIRVLEHLDPRQVEIICYSDRPKKGDVASRFQRVAALWRDVSGWSDDRMAEQIRADQIDLLFDLAGHTAYNRLLVFARKPAPIQLTWAGYIGTTGLAAMDYLLADRHQVPPGAEVHYSEKVLRMPDGYICYDPPVYAPPVADLPAGQRGYVTFASFNKPAKLHPQALALWARVLQRVPTSRLLLKFIGMDNLALGKRLHGIFAEHGIGAERVEIQGGSTHADLLAHYNTVDIALDPLPYNGGATTCEAMWMGVPVITWPGETFASRHSLSHLSAVGFTETVARTADAYVDIAAALAGDLPRLASLRAGLRQRMAASPLCDGARFATNLLALLRDAWRSWVRQAQP